MRTAIRRPDGCALALVLLAGCQVAGEGSPPARKATARAALDLRQLIPPPAVTAGWVASGDPLTYSPESLFEYVDGGAPRYVGYGFAAVLQVRYAREVHSEQGVTLDLYDMGKPLGAFGIYSSARPPDVPPREWCAEGYRTGPVAAAWKDRLFVHVAADEERPELVDLVERIVASVCTRAPGDPSPPPLLAALPREGIVPRSERTRAKAAQAIASLGLGAPSRTRRRVSTSRLSSGAISPVNPSRSGTFPGPGCSHGRRDDPDPTDKAQGGDLDMEQGGSGTGHCLIGCAHGPRSPW